MLIEYYIKLLSRYKNDKKYKFKKIMWVLYTMTGYSKK